MIFLHCYEKKKITLIWQEKTNKPYNVLGISHFFAIFNMYGEYFFNFNCLIIFKVLLRMITQYMATAADSSLINISFGSPVKSVALVALWLQALVIFSYVLSCILISAVIKMISNFCLHNFSVFFSLQSFPLLNIGPCC